jgi:uncharacterized protein (DUF2062 family)
MTPPQKSLDLKEYTFLREEIRHQDNLVNARLSWLVSSQSFLLSGFAVTLGASAHPLPQPYADLNGVLSTSLPLAGLVTDIASYLTIWAAIHRMTKIRQLAGDDHPLHLPTVQAETCTRWLGLAGPILIPVIFFTVWLTIIVRRWLL